MKSLPIATAAEPARLGFWQLVAEGEPYRLLFAVGTLLGVFGVFTLLAALRCLCEAHGIQWIY
ncbi:hypothetical protein [Ruficoccus sp. ZRK36]|uniref:hypothetical protein n=1 Tax=Ruficoccus sp. ZRK36 TaxID=2866311 RepID=UPI001C73D5C0|nr:hypothetical protein [Ruficoccus sp. ZRK36]QYY35003.1 hypothetical protein K0V07_11910 [Ruficoccus sp. ZRK36]